MRTMAWACPRLKVIMVVTARKGWVNALGTLETSESVIAASSITDAYLKKVGEMASLNR